MLLEGSNNMIDQNKGLQEERDLKVDVTSIHIHINTHMHLYKMRIMAKFLGLLLQINYGLFACRLTSNVASKTKKKKKPNVNAVSLNGLILINFP